uniref:Calcineurin B-like protein n=1 Tax=Oryza glumipatula TaxID=40148 RepID=A0A0D9YSB3_9ORYZ
MAGLVMSCCDPIPNVTNDGAGNLEALAAQTIYTVNEIEALYELFKRIDGAVIEDGKINMEEFNLRVFGPEKGGTLFADQMMCYFQGNLPLNRMHHPRRLIEAEQGKGTKLARGCCSTSSDFAQKLLLDLRRRRERLGFNSPAPPQSTSSSNAAALPRRPTLPRKGRAASNTFSDCTPPPPRRPSRRGCLSWRPTMTRRASGSSLRRAPPPPTSPRHGAADPAPPRRQERRLASDHYSCVPSSEFDHAIAAAVAAAVHHLTSIRKQPHHHPCRSPEAAAATRRCVEREVAALRRMHGHPHVVGLLDVLATRSTVYLVLKLARGVIATSVSPFPLSPRRARRRRSGGGGS